MNLCRLVSLIFFFFCFIKALSHPFVSGALTANVAPQVAYRPHLIVLERLKLMCHCLLLDTYDCKLNVAGCLQNALLSAY